MAGSPSLSLPPSLSVSLPLSSCDCCRLQGEGSHLCRPSDGWLQHVRSYMCVCVRGGCSSGDSKRVKVQMRSFIISIQSKEENTWTTLCSTWKKGCYSSHIRPSVVRPTPFHHLILVMKQHIWDIIGRRSVVYYGDCQKCLFHCFEKSQLESFFISSLRSCSSNAGHALDHDHVLKDFFKSGRQQAWGQFNWFFCCCFILIWIFFFFF